MHIVTPFINIFTEMLTTSLLCSVYRMRTDFTAGVWDKHYQGFYAGVAGRLAYAADCLDKNFLRSVQKKTMKACKSVYSC